MRSRIGKQTRSRSRGRRTERRGGHPSCARVYGWSRLLRRLIGSDQAAGVVMGLQCDCAPGPITWQAILGCAPPHSKGRVPRRCVGWILASTLTSSPTTSKTATWLVTSCRLSYTLWRQRQPSPVISIAVRQAESVAAIARCVFAAVAMHPLMNE
jgi:hypothetical protein